MFAEPTRLSCLLYYCKQFISNEFMGLGGINLSSKLSQAENVDLVLLITGGTARLPGSDVMLGQHLRQQQPGEPQIPNATPPSPSGDRGRQAPPSRKRLIKVVRNLKWGRTELSVFLNAVVTLLPARS